MNPLSEARAQLADKLSGLSGVRVYAEVPERLNPPCVALVHGNPYLTTGDVPGEFVMAVGVIALAPPIANDKATTGLDDLIARIAALLAHDHDWWAGDVTDAEMVNTGESTCLAITCTYHTTVYL